MAERINLHTLRPEDPAATALAVVLGFRPERDKTYVPWMKYILGHWSTVVSENDFFQLCRDTVKRFITGECPYTATYFQRIMNLTRRYMRRSCYQF